MPVARESGRRRDTTQFRVPLSEVLECLQKQPVNLAARHVQPGDEWIFVVEGADVVLHRTRAAGLADD